MSEMKQESIFHALKYTFASSASQAAEIARATNENIADTEFRAFFVHSGLPQATLTQSKLKTRKDGIRYDAQVSFIGGMRQKDALAIAEKLTNAGMSLDDEHTTFEGNTEREFGYMKLRLLAKDAADLLGQFGALQEKYDTGKKPAAFISSPAA